MTPFYVKTKVIGYAILEVGRSKKRKRKKKKKSAVEPFSGDDFSGIF